MLSSWASSCDDFFTDTTAVVIKKDKKGIRIFRIQNENGQTSYFKEAPPYDTAPRLHLIFDDTEMPVIAHSIAKSFGLEQVVPNAVFQPNGIVLSVKGKQLQTKPGILQEGVNDLITPIDDFFLKNPGKQPTAAGIQTILNQGEWPRLYADWKILWRIFMQTDLNIANLAHHNGRLCVFDTGDLLSLPNIRMEMGIIQDSHNSDFNMPGNHWDRIEHRPDFRKADPEYKNLVLKIANESEEATSARLGKSLDDFFKPPKGSVRDHVRFMKQEARKVLELLERDPFSY